MAEEAHVPDELRCNRSDGRRWRCKRRALPGKLLCDFHNEQVRGTSGRKKPSKNPQAPPSPSPVVEDDGNSEHRVPGREHLDREKKRKHSWALDIMEAYCCVEDETNLSSKQKEPERRRRRRRNTGTVEEGADRLMVKNEENQNVEEAAERNEENDEENENVEDAPEKDIVVAAAGEEVITDLPYGRMAIAAPPESVKEPSTQVTVNAPSPVKLGLKPPVRRLVNPKIRTKNVDQPPISTVKGVPLAENVRDKAGAAGVLDGKRKCHWCQRTGDEDLIKCLSCKKTSFCLDCIKDRCIDTKEIERRCIVCRGTCECSSCFTNRSNDASSKVTTLTQQKVREHPSLHYLITLVLPILEQINEEKRTEIEMEAKLKGQISSEVEIGQVETGLKEQISCNKCSSFILDMHRSCPSCSYKLCLRCCQECRSMPLGGTVHPSEKKSVSVSNAYTKKKQANKSRQNNDNYDNYNLFCPSLELGGCGRSFLDLKCVFALKYTTELELSAKETILSKESTQNLDTSLHCSLCSAMAQEGSDKKELLEASRRKHPGDNFLYCPSIRDDHETLLVHFQKHWRRSHPVIVRNLLENTCSMNWDPIALFLNYLKMYLSVSENDKEETVDPNCMDWYEVEFSTNDSFSGPMLKTVRSSLEKLKLKAKLCSALSQGVFADHFAEFIEALPIQEYTNPCSGILNLAAKSAEHPKVSEFSPRVYITCGSAEEIRRGELVAELSYSSHDLVNVLVHASDFQWTSDQVNKTKTLMRMKSVKDAGGSLDGWMIRELSEITEESSRPVRNVDRTASRTLTRNTSVSGTELDSSMMCIRPSDIPGDKLLINLTEFSALRRPRGVRWDIFRRQDAPKLVEYIQKHSGEFCHSYGSAKQVTDSVLSGNFFLDSAHKMKLKDEFKIEPWTIIQKLGEAVFIPAGCPSQMSNLDESCVNVVMGFISPENAGESIKLTDKLEALSVDHKAKASKVEVKKMVLNKIGEAVEKLRGAARN